MKEKIKKKKIPFPKKYTAFVKNNKTKKIRKIHFGIVDINNIKTEPFEIIFK